MRYSPEEIESLREHVIINNFVQAVGCHYDEARGYLVNSKWQYQRALSQFFQEAVIEPRTEENGGYEIINGRQKAQPFSTPTNTPNTPPDFPDALLQSFTLQAGHDQDTSNQNKSDGIQNSQLYYFGNPPMTTHNYTSDNASFDTNNGFTSSNLAQQDGASDLFEMDV